MADLVLDLTSDPDAVRRHGDRLASADRVLTLAEVKALGVPETVKALRGERWATCTALVSEHRTPSRWLSMVLLALLATAKRRVLLDRAGTALEPSWAGLVGREIPFAVRRAWISRRVLAGVRRRLSRLRAAPPVRSVRPRRVLFVRADLGPALSSGGSFSHIRGVVNGLIRSGCEVELTTPAPVEGIDPSRCPTHVIPPDDRYRLSVELPHLAYNATLGPEVVRWIRSSGADLVYHRHALGCFAAAEAAGSLDVPLVVEYNGPEAWIARHWGSARTHLDLFREIERRALLAADLIVAVSSALLDPLREMGISEERILINPNGVDPERFDPDRLAGRRETVRAELGVEPGAILVGFVGTFGPWHGAEVLARAAAAVPDPWAGRLRYLFIGDGERRARTQKALETDGPTGAAIFTGRVPPGEIPGLLSACDLCASPHVPNPDGSPFFGSPTKLFEYLASGRAVVASRLGQIDEILEHDRNAWLVPPGDVEALAAGMVALAADPELRRRLGSAARRDAAERHSWAAHVDRILERLSCPAGEARS